MNTLPALLAVLAASLSFSACSKPPYENVDNAQLQVLITQGVPVFDVRRPEEWKQTGVVEGCRLLTCVDGGGRVRPGFFAMLTADAPKEKPVAITCRTGSRTSQLAREMMEKHGYTKVYAFRGGLPEWIEAGYETVSVEKLPKVEIPKIRPADLKELLDSGTPLVLLDVRPAMETAKLWIDSGSRIELPFEDLDTRTAEIPRGKRIVIVDVNGYFE